MMVSALLAVTVVLLALASPVAAAVRVYGPEVPRIRLVKLATPPVATTVVVPDTPGAVVVIVTEAVLLVVTRLLFASCT